MISSLRALFLLVFFNLVLFVAAQEDYRIEQIQIEGNFKTKNYIILRELNFKVGDSIPSESLAYSLEYSRNMVFNTGLFNTVEFEVDTSVKQLSIKISVTERWYIWTFPSISYADRNFNVWWQTKDISRVNAGISIQHQNFRGRAEKLNLKLILGYRNQLEADYFVPFIDGKRSLGLQVQAGYTNARELWFRTDSNKLKFLFDPNRRAYRQGHFDLSLHIRPKLSLRHQILLGWEEIGVTDTVLNAENNPNYLAGGRDKQNSLKLFYVLKWDKRDIVYYPLKGHFIEWDLEPRYLLEAKDFHVSSRLNLEKFFGLGGNWFGGIGARSKVSFGAQPYNLYQAIGYKYVLRGFEDYVMDAEHFVLFKSNLKYRLFNDVVKLPWIKSKFFKQAPTSIFLTLYADAGQVFSSGLYDYHNDYRNRWLSGYGIGLDIASYYDRVIRFEYSLNNLGLRQLYIHFTAPI
ncbi:MAG: hypothetical protein EP332_14755 [Bacteroidetes bacterium]|nr:MAG: hypothetical protein EP332_14755 [Bacteroidota bacterium]